MSGHEEAIGWKAATPGHASTGTGLLRDLFSRFVGGVPGNGAEMRFEISDECIMCGTCEVECPEGAIVEGEDKYLIRYEMCVDCGTCAEECPVDAVLQEVSKAVGE